MPPCPGMLWPKSLILNARLKPEAKNPPNGATREAKKANSRRWSWYGAYGIVDTVRPIYFKENISEMRQNKRANLTNHPCKKCSRGAPKLQTFPHKDRVRDTLHGAPSTNAEIVDRADHVVEPHEVCTPNNGENNRAPKCAYKTFHCFFWRKLD